MAWFSDKRTASSSVFSDFSSGIGFPVSVAESLKINVSSLFGGNGVSVACGESGRVSGFELSGMLSGWYRSFRSWRVIRPNGNFPGIPQNPRNL